MTHSARHDIREATSLRLWSAVIHPHRRSGLTLLEVLIAIFVLLFGLLGVLTLIPVAIYRMNQALQADRATAVAQCAMEEIKVRQMLDPSRWIVWTSGGGWQSVPTAAAAATASPPYAIDPLFIARNATDAGGYDSQFPYGGSPALTRVTLNVNPSYVSGPVSFNDTMSVYAAERIFVCHDDLLVNTPDDPSQRPSLLFSPADGSFTATIGSFPAATSPAVRPIQGDYSWLATVSPLASNRFNVAIAVFRKRDTSLPSNPVDPDRSGERVVDVDILGGGLGGGEVRLKASSGLPITHLDALPSQWILLGTMVGANNIFQWYRIVAAGETTLQDPLQPASPTNPWVRELTLAGPDWNLGLTAQGVLFTGLILVHTESVELN